MKFNILDILGLRPKALPPRVFVSLNVFNAHRSRGLSQPATKVIVRISIWTLLVLLSLFMVVYTALLVYVDNTILQQPSVYSNHPKMKLTSRRKITFSLNKTELSWHDDAEMSHDPEQAVCNSRQFYTDGVTLPQCEIKTFLLILITSPPESKLHRQMIRATWCNRSNIVDLNGWRCIFLIGLSGVEKLNDEIRRESEHFNDMLIGNYYDSYNNLTLKTIHGFDWSVHYCSSSFILKTDQDCFVNTRNLHDFLSHSHEVTNLYAGNVKTEKEWLAVKRDKNSPWYVSYSDFGRRYYYPYASGMGYILSKDVAEKFIKESAFVKPISNEDAYVGIVLHRLGVKPTSSGRFVLSPAGLSVCNFAYLFVVHDVRPEQQHHLMNKALHAYKSCDHLKKVTTWS